MSALRRLPNDQTYIAKRTIAPVTRTSLPFQVLNVDLIGQFLTPSFKESRCILFMVDQHTRWAEEVSLTSLITQAICDVLLSIFIRVGVPSNIASDNVTNFNSVLTQEFERRISSD